MRKKTVGQAVVFLIPLLLGMTGFFLLEGSPFLDSLFTCILLYTMGYSDSPPNLLVEMARWTAPLATAGGVFLAAQTLRRAVGVWLRTLRKDSVAVYGPEKERAIFLEQPELKKRGIDGRDRFVRAKRYILTGSEEENLTFYYAHREALKGRQVYLKCRSIPDQLTAEENLRLFCPEVTAARLFWKQREVYSISKAHDHRMKIVMLGCGKLGQELLLQGLLDNIFHPRQVIEYHIFGGDREFQAVHTSLDSIGDPVIFHDEPWYEHLALIDEAALILILPQANQFALLQALLLVSRRQEIDVFAPPSFPIGLLEDKGRLHLFFWEQVACQVKNIFGDVLLERAKRINLRYCHLYSGVPETEEEKEKQWLSLDAFTRYSNISAADYHEIRLGMLAAMEPPADANALTPDQLELLAELEHIRWCRYHFLNNWSFGQPQDGSRKDKVNRIHADLIPYSKLTEEEKEKDRENIQVLFSVSLP